MKIKTILLLLLLACSTHVIAQSDFYYYRGKKIHLPLDENKICISILKDSSNVIERVQTNVQVLEDIRDNYDYYIIVVSRSDYEMLTSLNSWEEDLKSIVITPCYSNQVVASPYLDVELKQEQDTVLLTSFAKEYKLKIVDHSQLMPLWYILAITPDSPKNSVECANELFESGVFENSIPDLVDCAPLDFEEESAVQLIQTASTMEGTKGYDLYGREQTSIQAKGIIIIQGRKIIIE